MVDVGFAIAGNDLKRTARFVNVINQDDHNGPVVFTRPLRNFNPEFHPFLNEDFGVAMNQNAAISGTLANVHNGTDNSSAWTGTEISGSSVNFASTTRVNTGSNSIEILAPVQTDTWQFNKGSDLTVTNYSALSLFINVDRRWAENDSIEVYLYNTGTGLDVGSRLPLEAYFDELTFDVWHSLLIPFSDFIATEITFDSIRMTVANIQGASPDLFIDDINLVGLGATNPIIFKSTSGLANTYHIDKFRFVFEDAYDGRLANSASLRLSSNQILGVGTLTNGIIFQRVQDGEVNFAVPLRNLGDFLGTGSVITDAVTDGVTTMMVLEVEFAEPIVLKGPEADNFLSLTLLDDLSGLTRFNASSRGVIEV